MRSRFWPKKCDRSEDEWTKIALFKRIGIKNEYYKNVMNKINKSIKYKNQNQHCESIDTKINQSKKYINQNNIWGLFW